MTTTSRPQPPDPRRHPPPCGERRVLAALARGPLLEILGSALTLLAVGGVLLTYLDAHLAFLGATATADAENVRWYWSLVVLLGVGAVVSCVGAVARGAGAAYVWHVLTALVGVAVATTFSVTQVGPVDRTDEPPARHADLGRPGQPGQGAPPCFSGPPNDCPGG